MTHGFAPEARASTASHAELSVSVASECMSPLEGFAGYPLAPPHAMPLVVSRAQAYYWTHAWQAQERESREALAAGEFVEFDSDDANDVVRWLFGADDD